MPLLGAFARRELEDFEVVAIGVAEVERLDAAGIRIPVRQRLRFGRRVTHLVVAQPPIRSVHVAHDDRDVLEPEVVAVRIDRNRPSVRHDEVHQFDDFVAQLQPRDPYPHAEDAEQMFVVGTCHFALIDLFKIKHLCIESY